MYIRKFMQLDVLSGNKFTLNSFFKGVKLRFFSFSNKGNLTVDSLIDGLGPDFNATQFAVMMKTVMVTSLSTRCEKISGDGAAYRNAIASANAFEVCTRNWIKSAEFGEKYELAGATQDCKPLIKQ